MARARKESTRVGGAEAPLWALEEPRFEVAITVLDAERPSLAVNYLDVAGNQADTRVGPQGRQHGLEPLRVEYVVGIEHGEIVAPCLRQPAVDRGVRAPVLLRQDPQARVAEPRQH